jgi:glycosyltransferase involved in cell wall biosynthesis
MASGCPVVTSNTSSLPEVAGDSAVLVDPYDLSSITEAIYQLCSNSAYAKRLSELGKQRASQFTWNECALKVAEVYKMIT